MNFIAPVLFLSSIIVAAFHKGPASIEILLFSFLSITVAGALTLSLKHFGRAREHYTWLDAAVILFALLLVLTTLTGSEPHHNALGAMGLLLLVLAYRLGRALENREYVLCLVAVIALGAVMSAVGLHQIYRDVLFQGRLHPNGLFPNPNNFAAYLVMSTFLLGAVLSRAGVLRQMGTLQACLVASVLAFIMWLLVAVGGSRGAYLGGLGGLLVLVAWCGRPLLRSRIFRAIAFGALVGLLLGNLFADSGRELVSRMAGAGTDNASQSRLLLYQGAWELVREHPWLGLGPNMFMWAYPEIRLPAEDSAGFQVHNDYLAMAVNGGIPLALAFLLVLAAPAISAFRRRSKDASTRTFHGWLAAGVAAISIHALFTFNYSMPPILLAVGLVLGILARGAPSMGLASLRSVTHSLAAVVAIALLVLGGYALISLVGHRNVMLSQVAEERGNPSEALAYANEGVTWWPLADHAWGRRAEVIYHNVLKSESVDENPHAEQAFRNALSDAQSAIELNPYRWQAHYLLGRLHIVGLEQDYEEASAEIAEAALKESLRRNPRYFSARLRLVDFYRERDREREALDLLLRGLQEPSRGDLRSRMLKDARELAEALDDAAALEWLEAYEAESAETETDPEIGVGQLES